jgi:hypothetical protein
MPHKGIEQLNRLVAGVGFATTTKITYFARTSFEEGTALIYDVNVIKAITAANSPWQMRFRKRGRSSDLRISIQRQPEAMAAISKRLQLWQLIMRRRRT